MIPLWKRQKYMIKSRSVVAKVRNGKDMIHSLEHGTVLYQDCGDGHNNLHVLKLTELYTIRGEKGNFTA